MSVNLNEILDLVGPLDDSVGAETPRERFRRFISRSLTEVGQIRDCVEECLRKSADQYNRALQDLVNHIGSFLGFDVTFGRYRGVQGEIGFDGHWKSPANFHVVVEVKTTEVYAVKTATLLGYIDELVSDKKMPNRSSALGLYVVGRPDPDLRQLESGILAANLTNQLRTMSLESLISLAEMMSEYDISHEDILSVLRPSGPSVDSVVDLITRMVAQRPPQVEEEPSVSITAEAVAADACYWLAPVKDDEFESAEECVKNLVGREKVFAFGERTPGRKHIKPGDWLCFYATGKGVVAHAKVVSVPERKQHNAVRHPETFPWLARLDQSLLYLGQPVVIDASKRSQLDRFKGRDPEKPWAWFVQATSKLSLHDFELLTGSRKALISPAGSTVLSLPLSK